MRVVLAATLLAFCLAAGAQSSARPRPPGTVPLEEPPPPPSMQIEPPVEPVVTTRTEGEQQIQEYRVNGKLFMQRVTTKGGQVYVLMDHRGDGTFVRQDNSLDSGNRVPQWVLKEF